MVYNNLLKELNDKLKSLAKESQDFVSIGLNNQMISLNNIVKASEIQITEHCIHIHVDNLCFDFSVNDSTNIVRCEYGFENEYIISNDDTELYIGFIGA